MSILTEYEIKSQLMSVAQVILDELRRSNWEAATVREQLLEGLAILDQQD